MTKDRTDHTPLKQNITLVVLLYLKIFFQPLPDILYLVKCYLLSTKNAFMNCEETHTFDILVHTDYNRS